jgi:hypothetical protein
LPDVNIKTKEILALEVTYEKAYYGKIMSKMVEYIFKISNKNIKIKSVLGYGSYNSKRISNIFKRKRFNWASK